MSKVTRELIAAVLVLAGTMLLFSWVPSQAGKLDQAAGVPERTSTPTLTSRNASGSPEELTKTRRLYFPFTGYFQPAIATATPTGQPNDQPTATLTPTVTSTPTDTPTPTATATPTPTATPNLASGCPDGMEACWKLDEKSGATTFKDSARNYDIYCDGSACPSTVSGNIGNGLQFDGQEDRLVSPPYAAFRWDNQDSFSVELWVKTSQDCSSTPVFIGLHSDGSSPASWWVGCSPDTQAATFYLRDSKGVEGVAAGNKKINNGSWHLVTAVHQGNTGKLYLYVDGQEDASAQADFTGDFFSSQGLTVGSFGDSHYFSGRLDEVAIYRTALAQNDVRVDYFLARAYCKTCSSAIRIMPLGDSITEGYGSTNTNGYRRNLYNKLGNNGYQVDFVGSLQDGQSDFDRDHEGHGGWEAKGGKDGGVVAHVYDWLTANPADVVLLHIGTNDISNKNQNVNDISEILDEIDRYSPDVTVVLALIINRTPNSTATTTFNNQVKAMAQDRIAAGDKIVIVNMEPVLNYQDDMYDSVHPNDAGYGKMANQWYTVLTSILPVCP